MLNLFRRGKAPGWSGFESGRAFARFEKILLNRLKARGVTGRLETGVIRADHLDYDGMGVENIARLCAAAGEKHWSELVDGHLENTLKGRREAAELETYIGDFRRVEKILKARVWPEYYLETVGAENLVFRTDFPGTITCLCFDLPSTLINVSPGHVRAWKKKKPELFTKALLNLRRENKIQVVDRDIDDVGRVYTFSGAHYFTPGHVPDLLSRKKYRGRFGTLTAVPVRENAILYPVNDSRAPAALSFLIPNIVRVAARNPGFVSDKLYWHHEDKYHVVDFELKGDSLDIQPSPAVARLLMKCAEQDPRTRRRS